MTVALIATWIYVIIRASNVSFTSDETISYGIIHGVQAFVDTANNQWLNTLLMRAAQDLFGETELALRLPNAAAFGLYGVATLVLLSQVRCLEVKIAGFILLVANPFLLEFFGLARGYGLSMAFSAAAIACVFYRPLTLSAGRELSRLALIGVFGSLAFYANFSALNLVLALLAVEVIDLIQIVRHKTITQRGYHAVAIMIVCITVVSLVPGILQLRHLQVINQLYYGGHTGFVDNTIGSLLGASSCGYECKPTWLTTGEVVVVATAAVAILWTVGRFVLAPAWSNLQRAAFIFTLMVLATLTEALLLGTLYPIDRTALVYVIAFAALIAFGLDDLATSARPKAIRSLVGATVGGFLILVSVNFARNANIAHTTVWAYDASSHEVIDAVLAYERQHGPPSHPWKLITGFPRNEALNYYQARLHLTWLQPITRDPVWTPGGDLYYVGSGELSKLPSGTATLASFSDTGTQLRVRRPAGTGRT